MQRRAVVAVLLACGAARAAGGGVNVELGNPLAVARRAETLALDLAELRRLAPELPPGRMVVTNERGRPVLSQLVDVDGDETPDQLVFQVDLGPRQTIRLAVEAGERRPPARADFKVYGRFVRERHDDFAWENDRIAHRAYGPALETWAREPLTSSGIDVWCKRTRRLVVNDWYLVDDYHRDTGEGADLYSVGRSRGCGGSGVFAEGTLAVSRNFRASRVLANGPIRLVFELEYPPFPAGGHQISEVKRITLDAGQSFDRVDGRYLVDGKPGPLTVAVGIAKHAGGTVDADGPAGLMRTWEPLAAPNGHLGCGVVLAPGGGPAATQSGELDHLLVRATAPDGTFAYYTGFGWDKSGDVADASAWAAAVQGLARGLAAPVRVRLEARSARAGGKPAGAGLWAARTCDGLMKRTSPVVDRWHYDVGLVLSGFEATWRKTGDRRYLDYVKASVDRFVGPEGVTGFDRSAAALDDINMGKVLFALYADARDPAEKARYRKALAGLRGDLARQPRNADGGFWHKKIYPHQVWADGVYMAAPFLATYARVFDEPAALDEAVKQVELADAHLADTKTGLVRHGWDEQKRERWADKATGTSAELWGRGVGWYAMAVVDVLGELPAGHPRREALLAILRRLAAGLAALEDGPSGVWWQVLDAGGRPGNYKEASASAMFVYALSKGVKNGWLDGRTYGPIAARGFAGLLNQFVETDAAGAVHVNRICKVAGLGGDPYRDGSYDTYVRTEVVTDDPKGVGAFLLAAAEQP